MTSAISVIMPELFAVPSTLYTGISLVRGHVGMLLSFAYSMSMKQQVVVLFPSVIVHVLCPVGDLKNLQRFLL
jgi:hypothetical protein